MYTLYALSELKSYIFIQNFHKYGHVTPQKLVNKLKTFYDYHVYIFLFLTVRYYSVRILSPSCVTSETFFFLTFFLNRPLLPCGVEGFLLVNLSDNW
jgi:hypothetical protein